MEMHETQFARPVDVRDIRERLHLTRKAFALRYGISQRTLQEWEQERRIPDGPALSLLRRAERDATTREFVRQGDWDEYRQFRETQVRVRELLARHEPTASAEFTEHGGHVVWSLGRRVATMALTPWAVDSFEQCIVVGVSPIEFFAIGESPEAIAARIARELAPPTHRDRYVTMRRAAKLAEEAAWERADGRCELCGKANSQLMVMYIAWAEPQSADGLSVQCAKYCGEREVSEA